MGTRAFSRSSRLVNNERLERYARLVRLDVIPTQDSWDASRPHKVVAQLDPPICSFQSSTTNSNYVVMAQTCVCSRM
jgi:hypothetical protein